MQIQSPHHRPWCTCKRGNTGWGLERDCSTGRQMCGMGSEQDEADADCSFFFCRRSQSWTRCSRRWRTTSSFAATAIMDAQQKAMKKRKAFISAVLSWTHRVKPCQLQAAAGRDHNAIQDALVIKWHFGQTMTLCHILLHRAMQWITLCKMLTSLCK